MATTTAFGSLSLPAPDDTMEMSSPANRNLDDDIDIDFEDYQGGVQLPDDERMLEDGEHTRPTTATDDIMEDDLLPGEHAQIEEEIMRDDISQTQDDQQHQEDEELIDYGEEDLQEPTLNDNALPADQEPTDTEDIGFDQLGKLFPTAVEGAVVEVPTTVLLDGLAPEVPQAEESAAITDDFLLAELPSEDATNLEESNVTIEPEADEDTTPPATDLESHQSTREEAALEFPPALNTAVSTSTDTPRTPTDTGLHPMTIRYGDLLLPLFKSHRQPDGLLKDDNLANLSLAELITNCRQRLAIKIGENISEDQELVLGFEHMGLLLVEDCRAAFESSLHDVLEVYLQFHQNDGSEEVPPLSLNLSLQLKFQSNFAMLKQAAAGGQGMSYFNFLRSAAGELDEFYQEEYDNVGDLAQHGQDDAEDGFDNHGYGDGNYVDNGGDLQPGLERQDQPNDEDAGEQGGGDPGEYYQEGEYHEDLGDDEFYIPDQDEAATRLDELEAGVAYPQDPRVDELKDAASAADDLNATEPQAASTTSSVTVQGDPANNTAGEYDDDLIDWDDESLITTVSDHAADANQDFSTFLTEYEDEETKDGLPQDAPADGPDNFGSLANTLPGQSMTNPIGSEDFLNDPTSQAYGFEGQQDEHHGGEHAAGDQTEDEEGYTLDQSDTYDEQHEYNPDYQPGEGAEQFDTAQDFLNADQYEHGPEHDVHYEDDEGLDDTVGTVIHHETAEYDDFGEEDNEDDIGFDQEDGGDAPHEPVATISGKRSFDDLDELEEDDRELKKARAS